MVRIIQLHLFDVVKLKDGRKTHERLSISDVEFFNIR